MQQPAACCPACWSCVPYCSEFKIGPVCAFGWGALGTVCFGSVVCRKSGFQRHSACCTYRMRRYTPGLPRGPRVHPRFVCHRAMQSEFVGFGSTAHACLLVFRRMTASVLLAHEKVNPWHCHCLFGEGCVAGCAHVCSCNAAGRPAGRYQCPCVVSERAKRPL